MHESYHVNPRFAQTIADAGLGLLARTNTVRKRDIPAHHQELWVRLSLMMENKEYLPN